MSLSLNNLPEEVTESLSCNLVFPLSHSQRSEFPHTVSHPAVSKQTATAYAAQQLQARLVFLRVVVLYKARLVYPAKNTAMSDRRVRPLHASACDQHLSQNFVSNERHMPFQNPPKIQRRKRDVVALSLICVDGDRSLGSRRSRAPDDLLS